MKAGSSGRVDSGEYEGNLQFWEDLGRRFNTPGTLLKTGSGGYPTAFGPPPPGLFPSSPQLFASVMMMPFAASDDMSTDVAQYFLGGDALQCALFL